MSGLFEFTMAALCVLFAFSVIGALVFGLVDMVWP